MLCRHGHDLALRLIDARGEEAATCRYGAASLDASVVAACSHSTDLRTSPTANRGRGIGRPIQAEIEIGARATASCRLMSPPFSATITIAALVLPDTTVGMIEPSPTRRRSMPSTRTRSWPPAAAPAPIPHAPPPSTTAVPSPPPP